MYKSSKLLVMLALTVVISFTYFGCDQPDDVLTSVSRTNLYLNEERLPDTPHMMLYELWVANARDTVSLGSFGYDNTLRQYLNPDNTLRADSNKFSLDGNIDNYDALFVSVESRINRGVGPNAIMLIDFIASPTVKLRFPNVDSLWESTIRYSMESTSDGRNNSSTDGHSIWFATYSQVYDSFNDTVLSGGVLDWWLDSGVYIDSAAGQFIEANVIYGLDSILEKDTNLVFGLDSLSHTVVRFHVIDSTKTTNYFPTQLKINYNVYEGGVVYDRFSQDDFAFPEISDYGWKYKGWVVSPLIPQSAVGEITMPAWLLFGEEFDDTDGGLLTTGTFGSVDNADDGNPYSVSARVPAYPGEDFLQNLPGGMGSINLVPYNGGNYGKVFITVEPINNPIDSTNFPLIAFIGGLPEDRDDVVGGGIQQFTLKGCMQSNDPFRGFPLIKVDFERF